MRVVLVYCTTFPRLCQVKHETKGIGKTKAYVECLYRSAELSRRFTE